MFGNIREQIARRNIPARPDMGTMGGYGGGGSDMGVPPPTPQQQPQKRGTARRIAGYLADALAGAVGREGPYAASLERERLLQEKSAMDQQSRAAEYADFVQREQWKRANPAPSNNDTAADFEFIRQRLGDEAAAEFLRNKANPPSYRVGPDGQFYRVDTATPPTAPVGRLTPIEGGPGGSPSGAGFR